MKRVIITGATGFLGYRTARLFAERGYAVTGLGRNVAIGRSLEQYDIPFIRCELTDFNRLKQAFREQDYLVHCAALTRAGASPEEYRVANRVGSQNVMQAMLGTPIRRWIHLSTSRVYERDPFAIRETHPILQKSRDAFVESKRQIELDIEKFDAVPAIILRPQLIFGPGDRHLYPYLARFARWWRVPRFDGGDTMIDPVYVDNAVDAIEGAIKAPFEAERSAYNISNGSPVENFAFLTSLAETSGRFVKPITFRSDRAFRFAEILEAIYHVFAPNTESPFPTNYVRLFSESQSLNIDAAREALGYKPKIPLREAISILSR
jgi:nucleoside-diphosphate-sugar epimerase